MSICDACKSPGYCCKRLKLYDEHGNDVVFWGDEPIEEQVTRRAGGFNGFSPLEPIKTGRDGVTGRPRVVYAFTCDNLLPNGRCSVYEDRPQLCRDYEPASSPLCVHYEGPDE